MTTLPPRVRPVPMLAPGSSPKGRTALAVVREVVGDGREQLEMIAALSRGEVLHVWGLDRKGVPRVVRTLRPRVEDVYRACVYLVDRRLGRIPRLEPGTGGPGGGPGDVGALPDLPPELRARARALARDLVLGLVEQTQVVDVTSSVEKAASRQSDAAPDGGSAERSLAPGSGGGWVPEKKGGPTGTYVGPPMRVRTDELPMPPVPELEPRSHLRGICYTNRGSPFVRLFDTSSGEPVWLEDRAAVDGDQERYPVIEGAATPGPRVQSWIRGPKGKEIKP